MMALHEGMTYERDAEKRAPYAQRSLDFIDRITDTLSKKMIRKLKNRWDVEIWPWDREGRKHHITPQNVSDNHPGSSTASARRRASFHPGRAGLSSPSRVRP
jgi:hypothetical protein